MASSDDVYYRIYRGDDGALHVVCMQWFDELDYVQDDFITPHRFADEGAAQAVVNSLMLLVGRPFFRDDVRLLRQITQAIA